MNIRTVTLHGGPFDGSKTVVSHFTALYSGEIYVWDGSEDRNHFVHAKTLSLTEEQQAQCLAVRKWLEQLASPTDPMPARPVGPEWITNLAIALHHYYT